MALCKVLCKNWKSVNCLTNLCAILIKRIVENHEEMCYIYYINIKKKPSFTTLLYRICPDPVLFLWFFGFVPGMKKPDEAL